MYSMRVKGKKRKLPMADKMADTQNKVMGRNLLGMYERSRWDGRGVDRLDLTLNGLSRCQVRSSGHPQQP